MLTAHRLSTKKLKAFNKKVEDKLTNLRKIDSNTINIANARRHSNMLVPLYFTKLSLFNFFLFIPYSYFFYYIE